MMPPAKTGPTPPDGSPPRSGFRALGYEGALLWYALFSWRSPVETSGTAPPFFSHRRGGYGGIVAALLLAIAAEVIPVHLLLSSWSHIAAWGATILSVYGGLWLWGDFQAIRLRPSGLGGERLHVRLGLRWRVDIPLSSIQAIQRLRSGAQPPADLRVTLPGSTRVLLLLDPAVEAHGPYGRRRQVRRLVWGVDEPGRLIEGIGLAGAGGSPAQPLGS